MERKHLDPTTTTISKKEPPHTTPLQKTPALTPDQQILHLQHTIGNRAVGRLLQAKLQVSQPGDVYEREADHIAERVVTMPDPQTQPVAQRQAMPEEEKKKEQQVQMKPLAENITPLAQRQMMPEQEEKTVQTKVFRTAEREASNGVLPHAEEAVSAAFNSTGQPLPSNLHRKFEQALGVDLSAVRVHTDPQSIEANKAISARAYTIGSDIHFNEGQYNPESIDGQRLLAHEVAHTVQQGSSPVLQGKLIQLEGEDKSLPSTGATASVGPGPTASPASTTVNTLWSINFIDEFRGTGEKVEGRKQGTSLYVNQLKIAPDGEAGKAAPKPKVFSGVTLADTGSAEIGAFTHPKDKGGRVSGSVAYGEKPTFSFTIKTPGYDPKAATKEEKEETAKAKAMNAGPSQKAVVKELTAALDTFVDEAEAQEVLTRIVNDHFKSIEVEATIKMTSKQKTKPINVTDFTYGALAADKTFNLMVKIPNVTKDKSSVWNQTKGGEVTQGTEHIKEEGKEKGTVQKSTIETEFIQSFESAFMTELKTAAEKVRKSANLNENSTTHTGSMTVKNSTTAKLTGDISGGAELDLSKIPLAGKFLGKLLNAKVNINLKPDLSDIFELQHVSTDETAKKTVESEEATVRNELATAMTNSVKNAWSSKMRTQLETQTHETTTEKETEKTSGGGKQNESTSATSTSGTVAIVASAVQPVLVEAEAGGK